MTRKKEKKLIREILRLYNEKKSEVRDRIKEFKEVRQQGLDKLFEELVFCICTPQTKAHAADNAIKELQETGLLYSGSKEEIAYILKKNGVRFHNSKAKNIIEARENRFETLPKVLEIADKNILEARDFLVSNIRGLGLKEASHFLRNIGYNNLAIIDRHILRILTKLRRVREVPRTLTRKRYLEIEKKFIKLAEEIGITSSELDLVMWAMQTGEVFK